MLGSLTPTRTRETETLERLEQLVESIAYVAPELANQRRTQIVQEARRVIREWRAGR